MQKAHLKTIKAGRPFPDKLFYKIGEVSKIADVEPYVLRYWESEFSFLRPRKSKTGQRVYVKKDLELILQIKRLLYQERYTIKGVRKKLAETVKAAAEEQPEISSGQAISARAAFEHDPPADVIGRIKERLRNILRQLT